MEVIVKNRIDPNGRVLSAAEEEHLNRRIQDLEYQTMGKEVAQGLAYNPQSSAKKKLDELVTMKRNFGAIRFEGKDREQAEVEIRRLEFAMAKKWGGQFPDYETQYWATPRRDGIRYVRLRDTIVAIQKDREYAGMMARWKYLKRRMEPSDPNADSVLQLFDARRAR